MADVLTKEQRSYNMSRIKGKDTKPEIQLRKLLYKKEIRGYRIHYKLPGKPDLVFPKYKLAVFVDGCFWHKCPKCFKTPETNKDFWMAKINKNAQRDKKINKILKKKGWTILRFWEHNLKRKGIKTCLNKILNKLSI